MNKSEIDDFLSSFGLVGTLATLRGDGAPHAVPIWYRWDGEQMVVWSSPTIAWVKWLKDDPRVAFTAYENDIPSRAIYIRGAATLRHAPVMDLLDELRAITERYVAADGVDAYVESMKSDNDATIITITPTHIRGVKN